MIYIRIKYLCWILLMFFFSIAYGQPALSLRQKLERLLQDPEYNDDNNEVQQKPDSIHGMLLKDQHDHKLFDYSAEETLCKKLNCLQKTLEAYKFSKENQLLSLTTTEKVATIPTIRTTITSKTANLGSTPVSGEITSTVGKSGFQTLSSIISKFIDLWTKSL